MQSNHSKRNRASWGVFAALWAVLAAAAGGGASAAPVETVLYSFNGGSSGGDGAYPYAGLIADKEGALYGTTSYGGTAGFFNGNGTVFKLTPPAKGQTAWTETVLYIFCSQPSCSDGSNPRTVLIADKEGALYGTTVYGGIGFNGTVFKLTPPPKGQTAWSETILYRFTGGSDGAGPFAGLIADKEGALYGTTTGGGIGFNGTVFKLTPPPKGQTGWTETVLYRFCSQPSCSDGSSPGPGLIADKEGALYGTTIGGGSGGGTVFKLTPPLKGQTGWTETVLYRFCSQPSCSDGAHPTADGAHPTAGLIADKEGALYGTAGSGGTADSGTVFKLTPPPKGQIGWTETVLYRFCSQPSCSDGANPYAGLIADKKGALYGTTENGGTANSRGTVFKLTPPGKGQTVAWTETVLHSFLGAPSDGASPFAGLIADKEGALYGTTQFGGGTAGTVFKLTGTGFVTGIPFAAFGAKLAIDFGISPNPDAFELLSEFTLGQSSNGINPVAEPVTFQIGTFATTIPAGSFTGTGFGPFTFNGMIGGVGLGVRIEPIGTKRYALKAEALRPNLTGTKNPVPMTLTIGGDSGTVSVKADIY